MQIENINQAKKVKFANLSIGEVFYYDNSCYIKIDFYMQDDNAFNLKDNTKTTFEPSVDVSAPKHSKLIIDWGV